MYSAVELSPKMCSLCTITRVVSAEVTATEIKQRINQKMTIREKLTILEAVLEILLHQKTSAQKSQRRMKNIPTHAVKMKTGRSTMHSFPDTLITARAFS